MLLVSCLSLLLGGVVSSPTTPPLTTFSGHLGHAPSHDTVRLDVGNRQVKTVLSPSGDFHIELRGMTTAMPVHFEYAGQQTRLSLQPGYHLVMHVDFQDFDKTLAYSGTGAAYNNYLAQALYRFEYGPPGSVPRPLDNLTPATTPAQMRQRTDAFRQARRDFLASYNRQHPLTPAQRQEADYHIRLAWSTDLLSYVEYRCTRVPNAAPVPPSYFSFLAEAPLRELNQYLNTGLDENTAVARFLNAYQFRLAPSNRLPTNPAAGPALYAVATRELGDNKVRDMALRNLMYSKLEQDLPGALAFYPTYKRHLRDSAQARRLRQFIIERLALRVGELAPAFSLLDNSGKQVSLSDFRGKVVYLDFWGTWCVPCMKELTEAVPALKKQFEGRDVVFLYVSEKDTEANWQQTLAAQHLLSANAVHLREAPGSKTPVSTAYQVTSYPTYWLIGRDGRVLTTAAPRPSELTRVVTALEEALKH